MNTNQTAALEVCSQIVGTGMYVPERVVSNDYFSSYLETNDEWIRDRTGIAERRWADKDTTASELAYHASVQAIKNSNLNVSDIDAVILATVTPDKVFPSTACILQERLGISRGLAFDINAVCSGFLYALATADSLIRSGTCNHALVIGSDLFSRIIDPNDRSTCILFGDGAGAVVLSRSSADSDGSRQARGIYTSELNANGTLGGLLATPRDGFLTMNGREIFKLAVRHMSESSMNVLNRAGFSVNDVDFVIAHQANKRILDAVARQMEIPAEKVLSNVERFGNTSAASLPILMAESVTNGTLKQGQLIILTAFGGGVTWGSILLRW